MHTYMYVCVSYMLICACTHECTVAKRLIPTFPQRFLQLAPADSLNPNP